MTDWIARLPITAFVFLACVIVLAAATVRRMIHSRKKVAIASSSEAAEIVDFVQPGAIRTRDAVEQMWFATDWSLDATRAVGYAISVATLVGAGAFVYCDELLPAAAASLAVIMIGFLVVLIAGIRAKQVVRAELPEAVAILARAVRAGDNIELAILSCAAHCRGPLRSELRRCARRFVLGLKAEEAVEVLNERYRLLELRLLASTIAIQRTAGGDLAAMLERLSQVLYERETYRRQLASASASARMAALIVGAAAPLLVFYYTTQKEFFGNLWSDPSVRLYFGAAFGLEVVGFVWLLWLTRRDL